MTGHSEEPLDAPEDSAAANLNPYADSGTPGFSISTGRRSLPRRLLNRLEVDRATFYGMATRYWKFPAGLVTMLLIVRFFDGETQGFFYTFSGVIALQAFFELAFPQAIITTASHQWSQLRLDENGRIVGDEDCRSRLIHLMRISTSVFTGLALCSGVFAAVFGLWFFSDDPGSAGLQWRAPWLALVVLSTGTFALVPCLAILEGCNQVGRVYQMQLVREILGNVVVWLSIVAGANLWVPVLAMAVRLIYEVAVLFGVYGTFFRTFLAQPPAARLDWKRDVWPFQSRLIVKGFFSFLNADLMLLVIFRVHGSVLAGQFGLTWTMLSAVRMACSSWVRTRVPHLGALVKRRQYGEMDRIFFRVGSIALAVMLALVLFVCLGVLGVQRLSPSVASRFLPILPTAFLGIGLWAAMAMEFEWLYIHTHGKSPYLVLSLIGNLISGALILILGISYAAVGVSAAFLIMHLFVFLPMSSWGFLHLRRRWHSASAPVAEAIG